MRHLRKYRKLGRHPKHRKALFRNLSTQLIMHERIITTEAKARELRPWIEKLMRLARYHDTHNAHRWVHAILFSYESQTKLFQELVPRYDHMNMESGFTRVKKLGPRYNDAAEMAMIELIGNEYEHQDKVRESIGNGEYTFWEWEHKVLKQEQQHYKTHLDELQDKIDHEIEEEMTTNGMSHEDAEKIVEEKHKKDKEFMLYGLKRSLDEEEIHLGQQGYSKYRALNV